MNKTTCGDPECVMRAGHDGHVHAHPLSPAVQASLGHPETPILWVMWPKKQSRSIWKEAFGDAETIVGPIPEAEVSQDTPEPAVG